MALAQVDAGLKSFEAAYAERLHRWQEMARDKIRRRVQFDGARAVLDNGTGLGSSIMELGNDLINIRTRIMNFGRGQVNEELKRQEGGK